MKDDSLFDLQTRLEKINETGHFLLELDELIPWKHFRQIVEKIDKKERKSTAGRKPFDRVMMLKIVFLQELYGLSYEQVEFQIRDRLSFSQFLGIGFSDNVPDKNTLWDFREALARHNVIDKIFKKFEKYLVKQGYTAKKGTLVDASFNQVPRQRNTREENEKIKEDDGDDLWDDEPHKKSQKDIDARWTKKNDTNYYGYKNHVGVDAKHKLIRTQQVTPANVHDSQVLLKLLDANNSSKEVFADAAYSGAELDAAMRSRGFRPKVQRKGNRGRSLTRWEQQGNRTRSKMRARVEHVFGTMAMQFGSSLLRTIGGVRAEFAIKTRNTLYNMSRLISLERLSHRRRAEKLRTT